MAAKNKQEEKQGTAITPAQFFVAAEMIPYVIRELMKLVEAGDKPAREIIVRAEQAHRAAQRDAWIKKAINSGIL